MSGRDPYADWDGAYVLGALEPGERRDYERHLAGCDACQQAVAELAGLPGLLASLTADDVVGLARDDSALGQDLPGGAGEAQGEPAEPAGRAIEGGTVVPLARVAAAARRSRVRRRAGLVAAAAAVAVGAALSGSVLGGSVLAGGGEPTTTHAPSPAGATAEPRTLQLRPVSDPGMWADLTATPTAWGTRLEWSCRYDRSGATSLPPGAEGYGSGAQPVTYELVLVDHAGTRVVAATWTTAHEDAKGLGAASALPLTALKRIEIAIAGDSEPLASVSL